MAASRTNQMPNFKAIFSVYLKDNEGTFLTLILTFGAKKILAVKVYDFQKGLPWGKNENFEQESQFLQLASDDDYRLYHHRCGQTPIYSCKIFCKSLLVLWLGFRHVVIYSNTTTRWLLEKHFFKILRRMQLEDRSKNEHNRLFQISVLSLFIPHRTCHLKSFHYKTVIFGSL